MKLLALLAIASLAAAPAFAEVVSNETTDISDTIVNPCNGDLVTFSGTAHYVFSTTVDGNGGFHLHIHANAQVQGTGAAAGTKYSANEQLNYTTNANAGADESNVTYALKLIAQGKDPNFTVFESIHITVNANGTVTVSRAGTRADCK